MFWCCHFSGRGFQKEFEYCSSVTHDDIYKAQSFHHQVLLDKTMFSDSIYFFKEHYVKIMDLNTCSSQMQECISCRVYSL